MGSSKYGYSKKVNYSFDQAKEKTISELQKEGFGVLTEIDVKATLKKKIDVDIEKYTILGACNPPNAFKSIQTEMEIGLMLPCNVIIYIKNNETFVSSILPTMAMSMIKNEDLINIASNIESKLKKAIDNV